MPPGQTADSFARTIASLNDTYRLGLRGPDTALPPAKQQRGSSRSDEEERVYAIYRRLHHLHHQRPDDLSRCLAAFHIEARKAVQRAASPGGASAPPAATRCHLQHCLLSILAARDAAQQQHPKRSSDIAAVSGVKRSRSRTEDGHPHQHDVDAIPVQSTTTTSFSSAPLAIHAPTVARNALPVFPQSASARWSVSASETTTSFTTKDSSSHATTPATSRASFSASYDDVFPLCTQEYCAMQETLAALEPVPHPEADSNSTSHRASTSLRHASPAGTGSHTPQGGLRWPRCSFARLGEAPLAIIWEVTRIALFCGVDASACHLQYEPSWHDQAELRRALAAHGPFVGKAFPACSNPEVWTAALDSFHSKHRAVALRADLRYSPHEGGSPFTISLHPLRLDLGHRLSRRFGADRFLELDMPSPASCNDDPDWFEKVIRWLTQQQLRILCRTWSPFFTVRQSHTVQTPEGKPVYVERVHFFAVDGDKFRLPIHGQMPPPEEALTPEIRTKMSRGALLNWTVAIRQNTEQAATKLFTRISLSLSRARPTVTLEARQIRRRTRDIGETQVMNDGAGRMSRSLARKVAAYLDLDMTPAAFQGRIGSAKGLWLVEVDDDGLEDNDWIETYPSQEKWKCDFNDAAHRTFEVIKPSREPKSGALNQQFIPLLEACAKVPRAMRTTIADHLRNNLRSEMDALKDAALDEPAEMRLWLEQFGPPSGQSRSGAFLGGLPNGDEATIKLLLDAGFDHRRLTFLQELIKGLAMKKTERLKAKTNIAIPQSTSLFMVPDFWGVLEEGEVHIAFSSKFQVDGFCDTGLMGMDVLVARNPAHFASDIQKVRAVFCPRLHKLKDVVVMSTKGASPLADKLSGGDYDGDTAWVCFDRRIVDNFCNAPMPPRPDLVKEGHLQRRTLKVEALRTGAGDEDMCSKFIHEAFSFHMGPPFLGIVTKYKEKLCYVRQAVTDPAVEWLGSLLSHLVDQAKQGIVFDRSTWHRILSARGLPRDLDSPDYTQERRAGGPPALTGNHILDWLKFDVALPEIEEALTDFNRALGARGPQHYDQDLTRYYNDFDGMSTSGPARRMLAALRRDVDSAAAAWRLVLSRLKDAPSEGESDYASRVGLIHQQWEAVAPAADPPPPPPGSPADPPRQQQRLLLGPWPAEETDRQWALLKASLTFKLYCNKLPKFVWMVAGHHLCQLKALMRRERCAVVRWEQYTLLRASRRLAAARTELRRAGGGAVVGADVVQLAAFDDDDDDDVDAAEWMDAHG